jgi:hypothetical protein
MEGIIYNTEAQADAMQIRLHNRLNAKKRTLRYTATRYCDLIHHPTDGRVACPIDRTTHPEVWKEIEEEITPNEVNNVETLGADWFPTPQTP